MDYYETLKVTRKASTDEIQQSYRDLALKYHPDANPGNSEAADTFKAINKAYQTLRHPEKRKEYDLTLNGGGAGMGGAQRAARPQQPGRPAATSGVSTGNPMADILGDMMNAGRNAVRGSSEATVSADKSGGPPMVEIRLSAREAMAGATKTILVNGKPLRIKIVITH